MPPQRPSVSGLGDRRNRWRRILLFISALFLASFSLKAEEWWEKTPFTQWPGTRVYELLTDSPWVLLSPAGFRQGENKRHSGYAISCNYLVRIVTAQPIREALLRSISLQGKLVSAKSTRKNMDADQQRERLLAFMASRPDDLRIKGNDRQIIIAITLKIDDRFTSHEEDDGAELSNVDPSAIGSETSLATNTGRRVDLENYRPAGKDRLGIQFCFPRRLPDGSPLISARDKELRFATRINGMPVKVKFNLKKMIYKGKLEI